MSERQRPSLWERFDEFADRATELADKATDRARGLAAEHNDRIDAKLDRAAGFLDEKTGGKYSDRIGTGVGRAKDSLDRFAEQDQQAPGSEQGGAGPTGGEQAGGATGASGRN
ncbi:antitoxin [Actinocatenispora thailandica]|nr:antitoxin [Actinocatenispora thailandica]